MKTGYKLFRIRRDGTLGSLFIDRRRVIPLREWIESTPHPTEGYAVRPGWHICARPFVPHLSIEGRQWYVVAFRDYQEHHRPEAQGSLWFTARHMKVMGPIYGRR
jgi:hypothetical protein